MKTRFRIVTVALALLLASGGLAARGDWDDEEDVAPTPDLLLAADSEPEEPNENLGPAVASDRATAESVWSMDDCCDDFLCEPCCQCGPPGRFWLRSEYVGWWATAGRVPALVTTTTDDELPATQLLYGDARYNGGYRSGNWTQGGL